MAWNGRRDLEMPTTHLGRVLSAKIARNGVAIRLLWMLMKGVLKLSQIG